MSQENLLTRYRLSVGEKQLPIYLETNRSGIFPVVDEVYPFSDPQSLLAFVEEMEEKNIPYLLSVMPVYHHTDYPAMQEFCEILRYAQDHGADILLHAPIIQNEVVPEELSEKLDIALHAYWDYGIYPFGLEAPADWEDNDELSEILDRFDTILFLSDEDTEADTYQHVVENPEGETVIVPIPFSQDTVAHLEKIVKLVEDSSSVLYRLRNTDHQIMSFDGTVCRWEDGEVYYGGVRQELTYFAGQTEETFDYQRDLYYRFTANLENQNTFLIMFSALALALFFILVAVARRQMHRRFQKSEKSESKGQEEED